MESFGLLFRALVMLACLALVPFLCLYGKRIPDFAQSVMEAYKSHTHADSSANSQAATGGEAPPFAGATSRGIPAKLKSGELIARPLGPQSDGHGREASQASFIDSGDGRPAGSSSDSANSGKAATPGTPFPLPAGAASDTLTGDPESQTSDGCTVQFRRMEQRLRELGATYYLLETWGTNGDRYRFFCKMSLAGNADYNRNRIFQATAADPMQAMRDVLNQVEQWRSGK